MSIYQNTLSIAFMVPSSLHVAASTRVGNALGAGRPDIARYMTPTLPPVYAMYYYIHDRTNLSKLCPIYTTPPSPNLGPIYAPSLTIYASI